MQQTGKYLVLDTEASGTDFLKHGLTQLAALAVDQNLKIVASFNQDVRPPENTVFDPEALELTGFSLERIQNAKDYHQNAKDFVKFIQDNFEQKPIVIAQFYPFDYAFTQVLFQKTDIEPQILDRNFLDTKSITNFFNLKAKINGQSEPFPITSLSKDGGLKDKLELKKSDYQAHDALSDCMATLEVLKKLVDFLD